MATVVAVMDGPSFGHNTDVIVVVDPEELTLLWVPRDLWCEGLGRRINKAYASGGHDALIGALAEHDFDVHNSVCLRPDGIRAALEGVADQDPGARADGIPLCRAVDALRASG